MNNDEYHYHSAHDYIYDHHCYCCCLTIAIVIIMSIMIAPRRGRGGFCLGMMKKREDTQNRFRAVEVGGLRVSGVCRLMGFGAPWPHRARVEDIRPGLRLHTLQQKSQNPGTHRPTPSALQVPLRPEPSRSQTSPRGAL